MKIKTLSAFFALAIPLFSSTSVASNEYPTTQQVKEGTYHCKNGKIRSHDAEYIQCKVTFNDGSGSQLTYYQGSEFMVALYPDNKNKYPEKLRNVLVKGLSEALTLSGKNPEIAKQFYDMPTSVEKNTTIEVEGSLFHIPSLGSTKKYNNYIMNFFLK